MTLGIVTITSTSVHPDLILSINSSSPTKSAPALLASSSLSDETRANTFIFLPVPFGRDTTPLTISFAFFGSTPNLTAKSTEASNLVVETSLIKALASSREYTLVLSIFDSENFLFFEIFPITNYFGGLPPLTFIPIDLAVPATIFIAESIVNAFKSTILSSAIAFT